VIVAVLDTLTDVVVTVKVALLAPAATVTLAGTVAAAVLLESETTAPPEGAALVNVTVPVDELPPTTLVGFTDTEDRLATAGAAWGVKRRVLENGPNTPEEFLARTRHQSCCAGKPLSVTCDAVTV
jgi:hypothetical protein